MSNSKRQILRPTVVRESAGDARGKWWLMSRRESGWSAFGYPHATLTDLLARWAVRIVGADADAHGFYFEVEPAREEERA